MKHYTPGIMRIAGRILRMGENVEHRLCRPSWTSTSQTGLFDSHKHRHGRHLELLYYTKTEGFYKRQQRPIKRNVALSPNKGGTNK